MNPSTHVCAARSHDGRPVVAMIAKRAYRLGPGLLRALAAEVAVRLEPERAPSGNPGAFDWLVHDSDLFAPLKPYTDVVLLGSAHSHRGPVRMLDTGIRVGSLEKRVRVWGKRTIGDVAREALQFSQPEPFTSWPLTWEHAYGGVDPHAGPSQGARQTSAFQRIHERSPEAVDLRNPAGRGYLMDADRHRLLGAQLPNLEDPRDPVTPARLLAARPDGWRERPAPACYAPLDWTAHPRVWTWLRLGVLASPGPGAEMTAAMRALPEAYSCAPAGLAGTRLRGNERISLWNLHPRHEMLEAQLPGEAPRMLLEAPGCAIQDLAPQLQTVVIEPDAERVTVTWAASMEVAAPFPQEDCASMRSAVRWQA